jgi:2,4-dienoyl-CoA reductase-like NADH-dependent reductase (Old Yellow Enzyme family)
MTIEETEAPYLFRPLTIRSQTLRNRVVISPMCQNAAKPDGSLSDWHLVHLGQFALGGAALIFVESTAVSANGRINENDSGLWGDHQIGPLARVVAFVHAQGAALGVQIGHAGRKAGAAVLCDGGAPFPGDSLDRPDGMTFRRVGPSAAPAGDEWTVPEEMTAADIRRVRKQFVDAARRAGAAGVDVIELHYAHGYLVASFLSPLANFRADEYGGSFDGRIRLAMEIATDVRAAWPDSKPLFCRLSVIDGMDNGWSVEDSVALAAKLKQAGVDVIDCSSGGLTDATRTASTPRELGFQVPYAERIRREAGVMTQAVGMIVDPFQAEAILREGQADLIAIGREALYDPYWAHHAEQEFGYDAGFQGWSRHNAAYLAKRRPMMESLGFAPPPLNSHTTAETETLPD